MKGGADRCPPETVPSRALPAPPRVPQEPLFGLCRARSRCAQQPRSWPYPLHPLFPFKLWFLKLRLFKEAHLAPWGPIVLSES